MNIPILGQNQPDRLDREYGGVHKRSETAQGDVHDTEILELEDLFGRMLYRYSARSFTREEFEREAKERCHKIGFAIDIRWRDELDTVTRKLTGRKRPEIEIVGRVEKAAFDHDQKVHEVTRNVLELDHAPGTIKSGEARGGHPH
ncbi:hypothetical protein [Streptomyces sp. NPDC054838]